MARSGVRKAGAEGAFARWRRSRKAAKPKREECVWCVEAEESSVWTCSAVRRREKEGVRLRHAAEKSRRGMWERGAREGVWRLREGVDGLCMGWERRSSRSSGELDGGAWERGKRVPVVVERDGKGEARKVDMVEEELDERDRR